MLVTLRGMQQARQSDYKQNTGFRAVTDIKQIFVDIKNFFIRIRDLI